MKMQHPSALLFIVAICLAVSPTPSVGQQKPVVESTVQIPATAAGNLLSQWLTAFNTGDKDAIQKFLAQHLDPAEMKDPDRRLRLEMGFRQQTGGFDREKIEDSTAKRISGTAKEKNSGRHARVTLSVSEADRARIAQFDVQLIAGRPQPEGPPPAKVPVNQLTEEVDAELTKLATADMFSGAVLLAKDGKVLWQKAYGLADRKAKAPNTSALVSGSVR